MRTATLDNPPCRQKGLHDRIQLSSHNLKVGKHSAQHRNLPQRVKRQKRWFLVRSRHRLQIRKMINPFPAVVAMKKDQSRIQNQVSIKGFLSDFTQVNIQKITFKNELMDHPAWWFLDYGTFLLTLVISLLIKVLICFPRTEICVKPCYTH